ncbi:hypothetical protein G7046_g6200 [Stylonectria norvegica]|nr:hypothetical protein G7046_g6200 [Stylonectria norvegica]
MSEHRADRRQPRRPVPFGRRTAGYTSSFNNDDADLGPGNVHLSAPTDRFKWSSAQWASLGGAQPPSLDVPLSPFEEDDRAASNSAPQSPSQASVASSSLHGQSAYDKEDDRVSSTFSRSPNVEPADMPHVLADHPPSQARPLRPPSVARFGQYHDVVASEFTWPSPGARPWRQDDGGAKLKALLGMEETTSLPDENITAQETQQTSQPPWWHAVDIGLRYVILLLLLMAGSIWGLQPRSTTPHDFPTSVCNTGSPPINLVDEITGIVKRSTIALLPLELPINLRYLHEFDVSQGLRQQSDVRRPTKIIFEDLALVLSQQPPQCFLWSDGTSPPEESWAEQGLVETASDSLAKIVEKVDRKLNRPRSFIVRLSEFPKTVINRVEKSQRTPRSKDHLLIYDDLRSWRSAIVDASDGMRAVMRVIDSYINDAIPVQELNFRRALNESQPALMSDVVHENKLHRYMWESLRECSRRFSAMDFQMRLLLRVFDPVFDRLKEAYDACEGQNEQCGFEKKCPCDVFIHDTSQEARKLYSWIDGAETWRNNQMYQYQRTRWLPDPFGQNFLPPLSKRIWGFDYYRRFARMFGMKLVSVNASVAWAYDVDLIWSFFSSSHRKKKLQMGNEIEGLLIKMYMYMRTCYLPSHRPPKLAQTDIFPHQAMDYAYPYTRAPGSGMGFHSESCPEYCLELNIVMRCSLRGVSKRYYSRKRMVFWDTGQLAVVSTTLNSVKGEPSSQKVISALTADLDFGCRDYDEIAEYELRTSRRPRVPFVVPYHQQTMKTGTLGDAVQRDGQHAMAMRAGGREALLGRGPARVNGNYNMRLGLLSERNFGLEVCLVGSADAVPLLLCGARVLELESSAKLAAQDQERGLIIIADATREELVTLLSPRRRQRA